MYINSRRLCRTASPPISTMKFASFRILSLEEDGIGAAELRNRANDGKEGVGRAKRLIFQWITTGRRN